MKILQMQMLRTVLYAPMQMRSINTHSNPGSTVPYNLLSVIDPLNRSEPRSNYQQKKERTNEQTRNLKRTGPRTLGCSLESSRRPEGVQEWSLPARFAARGPLGRELRDSGGGERRGTTRRGSRRPRLRLGRRDCAGSG